MRHFEGFQIQMGVINPPLGNCVGQKCNFFSERPMCFLAGASGPKLCQQNSSIQLDEGALFFYPVPYYTWRIEKTNLIRFTLAHHLGLDCLCFHLSEISFIKTERQVS